MPSTLLICQVCMCVMCVDTYICMQYNRHLWDHWFMYISVATANMRCLIYLVRCTLPSCKMYLIYWMSLGLLERLSSSQL